MYVMLNAGVERIVHVMTANLVGNMKNGTDLPVVAIRLGSNPEKATFYRHAEILGPATLLYTPNYPIPGTDGRAVCVLRTSAAIRAWQTDDVFSKLPDDADDDADLAYMDYMTGYAELDLGYSEE